MIVDFIANFSQSTSLPTDPPVLYISGTPGTGKTALVNSILGETREMLEENAIHLFTVNCMALDSVDALLERLLQELNGSEKHMRRGGKGRTTRDTLVSSLQTTFAETSRKW